MTRYFMRALGAVAAVGVALGTVVATSLAGAVAAGPSPARVSNGRLYGVAALSATDAWAVGLHPGALIVHWDGTSWTQSFSRRGGFLYGVAATSAHDVWAAGGSNWFRSKTVVDHWDGTSWTRVHTPSPGTASYLRGVAATSATDAWAVGLIGSSPGSGTGPNKTLIEHWDGTAWTRVHSPTPRPGGVLYAVAAVSPTDAWAAGWTGRSSPGGHFKTLILHWDGTAWTRVHSPSPPRLNTFLNGVAATSATDAWAVGKSHIFGPDKTYILHWDGTAWTRVPSPNPQPGGDLEAVTAHSASDAWATGMSEHHNACSPPCRTLIEHWDGATWKIIPSPNPPSGYLNLLLGVAATAANDTWAVGTTDFNGTLIEHWDGTIWTQVPSPQYSQTMLGASLRPPPPPAR